MAVFGWADSAHTQRWVRGMAERGYDIKLISLGGEPLDTVRTVVLPRGGKLSYLSAMRRAVAEAQAFKPHLLHVHYAAGFGWWGIAAEISPLLVSVWGSDVIGAGFIKRVVVRRVLQRASAITATSEYLRGETTKLLPAAREKTTVIPFGVEIPESITEPSDEDIVHVAFLKAHRKVAGPDLLITAMERVVREVPQLRLSIAGSGDMTRVMQGMIQEKGLGGNITFVGHIDPHNVYSFIKQQDFLVMPSRRESFGVAALEAAACGRPVVASNVGGLPEVVEHDHTGLLVPPSDSNALADAIIKLAGDADLRRRLGRQAYEMVAQKYRWEDSLDRMAAMYEHLIDENA